MSQSNAKAKSKSTKVTRPDSSGMVRSSRQTRRILNPYGSMHQSTAPTSIGTTVVSGGPKQISGHDSVTVIHRELISSITRDSAIPGFRVAQRFPINPGLPQSFPWLSAQAVNWDQYSIKSLRYEYVPSCPTTAPGQILLIPEYDPTDQYPVTEADALNNYGCVSAPVWSSCVMNMDPSAMRGTFNRKFIRSDRKAGDLRTFDSGQLFVATTDTSNEFSTSLGLGKLYAVYEITLCVAQKRINVPNIPTETTIFETTSPQTYSGAPLWRTVSTPIKYNNLNIQYDPASFSWLLPNGSYRIDYFMSLSYVVGVSAGDNTYLASDIFLGSGSADSASAKNVFTLPTPYASTGPQEVTLSGSLVLSVQDVTQYFSLKFWNGSTVGGSTSVTTTVTKVKVVIRPA